MPYHQWTADLEQSPGGGLGGNCEAKILHRSNSCFSSSASVIIVLHPFVFIVQMDFSQYDVVPSTQDDQFSQIQATQYPAFNATSQPSQPPFANSMHQFLARRTPIPCFNPHQSTSNNAEATATRTGVVVYPAPVMHSAATAAYFSVLPPGSAAHSDFSQPPIVAHSSTPPPSTDFTPAGKTRKSRNIEPKKDAAKKKTKRPAVPKTSTVEIESSEDDDDAGKPWQEKHVVALLHARCEMNKQFSERPKQGTNLWGQVHAKVVATCPDFKKDAKACRKKFQYVLRQFQADVTWNSVSGNDRRESCPYYSLMDSYFGERANVRKHVHAGAIEEDNESEIGDTTQETLQDVTRENVQVKKETPNSSSSKTSKKETALHIMEDLLEQGKQMNETLKQAEAEKLLVLKGIGASIDRLIDKI